MPLPPLPSQAAGWYTECSPGTLGGWNVLEGVHMQSWPWACRLVAGGPSGSVDQVCWGHMSLPPRGSPGPQPRAHLPRCLPRAVLPDAREQGKFNYRYNLKISRGKKMSVPEEAQASGLCQSGFSCLRLCPQVSWGAKTASESSLCPPPSLPVAGIQQASDGCFQELPPMGTKAHWWAGAGTAEGRTVSYSLPSLGQGTYPGQELFHHHPCALPGRVLFPAHPHLPPRLHFPC